MPSAGGRSSSSPAPAAPHERPSCLGRIRPRRRATGLVAIACAPASAAMSAVLQPQGAIARPGSQAARPSVAVSSVLAGASLIAYICQVAFFGPIRYFLVAAHLEMLWYL